MRWMIDHYYADRPMTAPRQGPLLVRTPTTPVPAGGATSAPSQKNRGWITNVWFRNVEYVAAEIGPKRSPVGNIYSTTSPTDW